MLKTQVSQSDLYASEKMSIGGRASVRGFDGLSLSGQIGVIFRNDLVYYLPSFSHKNVKTKIPIGLPIINPNPTP